MNHSSFRNFVTAIVLAPLATLIVSVAVIDSAYAQTESTPVTQVVIGDTVLGFGEQPRLLNVYQAAELPPMHTGRAVA